MKKLLTLALGVAMLAAFTGLSVAQERKAGEKSAPPKEEPSRKLKGAQIVGKELILEKGFTFRKTQRGVQVVDPTGRYSVNYVCTGCAEGCGVIVTPKALLCGGKCSCAWEETK